MRKALLAGFLIVATAGASSGQEPPEAEPVPAEEEEARPEPQRRIRVLDNPYDLASFYRSRQAYPGFAPGPVWMAPYPIASYYRQGAPGHYARFWTSGYGPRRPGFVGYRRTIGENGELCLFAPAILAPVGPLTSVFFEAR